MSVPVIGIYPPAAAESRPLLFTALAQAFEIKFEKRKQGEWTNLSALILFEFDEQLLQEASETITQIYAIESAATETPETQEIHFLKNGSADSRLLGQRLHEISQAPIQELKIKSGDQVNAEIDGNPVWLIRQRAQAALHILSTAPEEIADKECLRDQLKAGRFFGLLPLIQFLRELKNPKAWTPPPLRANLHFDDPNLHSPKYGYVNYQQLAEHATQHNYHASMAYIPIDGWRIHQPTAKIFQQHSDRLSLLMHGNNHTSRELKSPENLEQALSLISQAITRSEKFEKKSGVRISRIMAAPHGACCEATMQAMLLLCMEGLCNTRALPWLTEPPADYPLATWDIGDLVCGGFPVLQRRSIPHWIADKEYYREEIVLRAFLNQPLILAGHHNDLKNGLDVMQGMADQINSFGEVQWMSMEEIARSNYYTRIENSMLQLKLYCRNFEIQIPENIQNLQIQNGYTYGTRKTEKIQFHNEEQEFSEPLNIQVTPEKIISGALSCTKENIPEYSMAKTALWPVLRRLMAETRDRVQPILGKG